MILAYFSPFPPKQTGIATYSEYFVAALRQLVEVHCFDFHNSAATEPGRAFGDFAETGRISDLKRYDSVVYHLGNNPHYHLDIYRTARHFPGILVLHDVVLYFLFASEGLQGLVKHFLLNYGAERINEIGGIISQSIDGNILRYQSPEIHPLTKSIFSCATRIVVHNKTAQNLVRSMGYRKAIDVLPLLDYPRSLPGLLDGRDAALRRRYSLSSGELIIGCFGFLGRTKRLAEITQALSIVKAAIAFKFVIAGEGDDPTQLLVDSDLVDRTIHTRFVSEEDFTGLLQITDIVLNLRFPSMGESSATLIQAMSLGKACIVSKDAFFDELPSDCVVKIEANSDEVTNLAAAIIDLATNTDRRAALGEKARDFVAAHFNPPQVAAAFKRIVEADIQERAQASLLTASQKGSDFECSRALLRDALNPRLPDHLRTSSTPNDE